MRVFKFGGASVKDAQSVKNIATIIQKEGTENLLVVISAMGKMTNAFELIVDAYFHKTSELEARLEHVKNFHHDIMSHLFDQNNFVYKEVHTLFDELEWFLTRNTSERYNYVYDQIICFGELLSTKIMSAYLTKIGVSNNWFNVTNYIKTDSNYRDAKVNWELTQEIISRKVNTQKLNITQGFLAGNDTENTTTLGREGSDYTAAIFAYCLNAESVTIWKDVSGVLNADPRVFKTTTLLTQISYEETIEMAFYGASVIHPKTLQPLQSKQIPLVVRSFKDRKLKGTKITKGVSLVPHIPCYIVKKNQILIAISSLDFSFMVENNLAKIFQLLDAHKLYVNLIQNSAISFSVCVDNRFNGFNLFQQEITKHFKITVHENVTIYTVRHFSDTTQDEISKLGTPLLTQINKETLQVILQSN